MCIGDRGRMTIWTPPCVHRVSSWSMLCRWACPGLVLVLFAIIHIVHRSHKIVLPPEWLVSDCLFSRTWVSGECHVRTSAISNPPCVFMRGRTETVSPDGSIFNKEDSGLSRLFLKGNRDDKIDSFFVAVVTSWILIYFYMIASVHLRGRRFVIISYKIMNCIKNYGGYWLLLT